MTYQHQGPGSSVGVVTQAAESHPEGGAAKTERVVSREGQVKHLPGRQLPSHLQPVELSQRGVVVPDSHPAPGQLLPVVSPPRRQFVPVHARLGVAEASPPDLHSRHDDATAAGGVLPAPPSER